MLHAVIMAGGSGTRFWPESREARPKQLLRLLGARSMIQATVDRLAALVPLERLTIVTNRRLIDEIQKQLPQLPSSALVGEPCRRDTAPCIGLAALLILRQDPDAVMAVMPADHVIGPDAAFQQALCLAEHLVRQSPQRLVTFGIRPTYPAESFGYIERGDAMPAGSRPVDLGSAAVYTVRRFREKPKADVAREYLESGVCYWNSGIFVWRAATIVAELAARQPQMVAHLRTIADAAGSAKFDQVFAREFEAIGGISIDYAVMEHARDVLVIEAPFTWDDVGSWQAISRLAGGDAQGNTISGRHVGVDTTGTIVRSTDDHVVVTLGVKDLIVVHTPDATLVASKHDEEAIRQVVKIMAERGWQQYL
ncbi:MAG: mannose-1-phosphate guanylyltransferase [Pirellulales bacterium]